MQIFVNARFSSIFTVLVEYIPYNSYPPWLYRFEFLLPKKKYTMDSLRIIVADDHPLFREGLEQALLRIEPSFIIYSASNGNEVLDLMYGQNADLVFLDIRMPGKDGIETTRSIRKFNKQAKIVVVSMIDDRATVQKVFKAGANGYLHKNTDKKQLQKVIDAVLRNELFLCDELSIYQNDIEVSDDYMNTFPAYGVTLSEREIKILQLICNQYSSKQIGIQLNLSEKTIEGYRVKLMLKTRSKNVAGLIMYAIDNGYISWDHKKII